MQPTAGRPDAPLHFMKTPPLQFTLALAGDTLILFALGAMVNYQMNKGEISHAD